MKRACLLLPAVLWLAAVLVGCSDDETKPKITRITVAPSCGVAPLDIEAFAVASGGDESGDPMGGNNNLEFSWTFGDGGTGATSIAYHSYAAAQAPIDTYTVIVTATDPAGNTATARQNVIVLSDSLLVGASTDYAAGVVTTADTVTFFASAESCDVDYPADPGDEVKLTFRWQMGDAANTVFTGATPRFRFTDPGVYDVAVTVTYPAWAVTRQAQIQLTVDPAP